MEEKKEEIKLLKETNKDYYITWNKIPNTSYYKILGCNNLFEYQELLKTTNSMIKIEKEKLINIINIKVNAIILDTKTKEETLLKETSPLKLTPNQISTLNIKTIKSYKGLSISFQSKEIYDRYYLYERKNEKSILITETEDFQVTLKEWNQDQIFYVEAYKKENDEYKLVAQSNEFHPNIIEENKKIKTDLSIIIPVYNAELFLSRCLDSILFSTNKNYEILLIDDGSTDTSRIIMNWYHEQYKDYIRCIYKENEGVSKTRNEGIKEATGEYIAFVDNDDLVHPFMYENLLKTAKEYNSDIVIGKALIRKDIEEHTICLNLKENACYSYEKMILEKSNHTINNIFFVAVWNKIIRASIVKEHPFSDSNFYEDTNFTRTIYSYIDTFYFNKDAYYIWDKRFQKTVGTASNNYLNKKYPDPLFYQKKYRDATFFCIENGNKNKIQLLLYDSIKEVIEYLKKINRLNNENRIKYIYDEKILELSKKYNLLENPYIKNNNEILQYIKNLIETKKDF